MTLPETPSPNTHPPQQLRFALLHHHDIPSPHWDLLLETSPTDLLATWRILTPPEHFASSGVTLQATRINPHRRIYLDYQGPISHNRGSVTRILAGTWQLLSSSPSTWTIRLQSPTTTATLTLPLQEEPAQ